MSAQQIRSVGAGVVIAIVGFALKYFFNVSVSRFFSPAIFGDFSLTFYLLNVLCPVVIWGGNMGVVRFVTQYLGQKKNHFVYQYFHWLIKVFFASSIVVLVFAAVLVFAYHRFFVHNHFFETHHLLMYCIWLLPVLAMTILFYGVLNAFKHSVISTLCMKVMKYFILLVILYAVSAIVNHTNTMVMFWVLLMAMMAQFTLLGGLVLWSMHQSKLDWKDIWKHDGHPTLEDTWSGYGRLIMMQGVVGAAAAVITMTWLEILGGSESDVGYLAAFFVISGIILTVSQCIGMVTQSTISDLAGKKDMCALQCYVGNVQAVSLLVNVVLCAVMVIFAHFFLQHFGGSYLQWEGLLRIYLVCIALSCYFRTGKTLCQMLGYQKWSFGVVLACFTLLLFGGGLAVYYFDLVGGVYVDAATYLLNCCAMCILIYMKTGISVLPFGLFSWCKKS